MGLTPQQKLTMIRLIHDKRHILFEKGHHNVEDKRIAWMDVVQQCREIYGFDPAMGKDWTYLRNKLWDTMRRHALEKFEQRGRKKNKALNAIDQAVLAVYHTDPDDIKLTFSTLQPLVQHVDTNGLQEEAAEEPMENGNVTDQPENDEFYDFANQSNESNEGETSQQQQHSNPTRPSWHGIPKIVSTAAIHSGAPAIRVDPVVPTPTRRYPILNRDLPNGSAPEAIPVVSASDEFVEERRRNIHLQNELLEAQIAYWKTRTLALEMEMRRGNSVSHQQDGGDVAG